MPHLSVPVETEEERQELLWYLTNRRKIAYGHISVTVQDGKAVKCETGRTFKQRDFQTLADNLTP